GLGGLLVGAHVAGSAGRAGSPRGGGHRAVSTGEGAGRMTSEPDTELELIREVATLSATVTSLTARITELSSTLTSQMRDISSNKRDEHRELWRSHEDNERRIESLEQWRA